MSVNCWLAVGPLSADNLPTVGLGSSSSKLPIFSCKKKQQANKDSLALFDKLSIQSFLLRSHVKNSSFIRDPKHLETIKVIGHFICLIILSFKQPSPFDMSIFFCQKNPRITKDLFHANDSWIQI